MTFVPIRDAVVVARTDAATIRRWARDGLLTTDTADDGEPLFQLQDLVRLERDNRHAAMRHGYRNLASRLLRDA